MDERVKSNFGMLEVLDASRSSDECETVGEMACISGTSVCTEGAVVFIVDSIAVW
jgi:hypothetical protein